MRVLVACEFSGVVRDSFIDRGHDAWSCDILDTESTGNHFKNRMENVIPFGWDLIIAHPPCTSLAVSGNSTYGEGKEKHIDRINSAKWVQNMWDLCVSNADKVCFENPVGVLVSLTKLPKPQYIQPYQFGHPEQKKTALFLHNLQPLKPTNNVYEHMMKLPKNKRQRLHYLPPSVDRAKIRSTTFSGIAYAMSDQWG